MKRGLFVNTFNNINYKGFSLKNNQLLMGFLILTFFILIVVSPTSALYSIGPPNYSINTIYGPEDNVSGWVNVSFSSESLGSLFTDSRGNSADLKTVLAGNTGYSYTCNPLGCLDDYSASNPTQVKTTTLNSGNSQIFGVRLTGVISTIDSLEFNVESNAGPACTNQLEVDFLDDGVIDFKNRNAAEGGSCSNLKDYGCFDSDKGTEEVIVSSTPACEKINLSDSPGFKIGAWVKKTGSSGNITAAIYTKTGAEVATCLLPDANSSGGEVSCSVDYSVIKPEEHYVCIYLSTESGDYKTKGYSASGSNACGFYGTPIRSSNAAYQIFAQGKQFDTVGTQKINESSGQTLANLAEEYLLDKYGNLNCSAGCVLPIKVTSKTASQQIVLKDLQVSYEKEFPTVETSLYEVTKTPAKITSQFQKLYIDQGGFSVPDDLGDYSFLLRFNGDEIISEKLEVKDVPLVRAVTPNKVAAAYPTEFTMTVSSDYNLTGFTWDFGDNSALKTTTGNKTTHTYNQTGEYMLKVTATDQRQLTGTKTFLINVSSPKNVINVTLLELRNSLNSIKTGISSLDQLSKTSINRSLNLSSIEASLSSLEASYRTATTEAQYNAIVAGLLKLNLPESIFKTREASDALFISGPDYVDIDALMEIAGGNLSLGTKSEYAQAAAFWQVENLETLIDFQEFSGRYNGYLNPLVKTFTISTDELKDISYDYYLVLPELAGFYSEDSYSTESGFIYANMKDEGSFSFSTTEDIDLTDLPAFISPSVSRLSLENVTPPEEDKRSKWITFGLVIIFLLFIAIIVYIILQEWYRRKYEAHLFPNRNDLYNMANYINNAKRKGLHHNEIEANLKKAGWSAERIRYAMRKYAGRRTGMIEIPVTDIIKKIGGENKHPNSKN